MRKGIYRPAGYSGLHYAGGGSVANIGAAMIGGGLKQEEKNQALKGKKKALKLEGDRNDFSKARYADARLDISKKESAEKANKSSNIKATRNLLESQYKIDTTDISDDDIHFNGDRLQKIYQDKTDRKVPKFLNTAKGIVAVYNDDKGNPVTELIFAAGSKVNKDKVNKTDGYMRMPANVSAADSDNYSSKTSFEGIPGTWISQDEYMSVQAAKKLQDKKLN